jgi:hypothetical protein
MPRLYAFLVAIDTYPEGIRSLNGCVNDADSMLAVLQTRFGSADLHIARLTNKEVIRDKVIETFRSHCAPATKEDVVLFYYAGHGSQVDAGEFFKEIEPDHKNESIVCYDSRPNGLDLVDKDIGVLIGELTSRGVHVTTIFDSCHSGSITRDLPEFGSSPRRKFAERQLPLRKDPQPKGSYLRDPALQAKAIRDVASGSAGKSSVSLATAAYTADDTGLHVLLAACEPSQTAKEFLDQDTGQLHGGFTYFLTQTLQKATSPLGYRELIHQVRDAMRMEVPDQNPKLESSGGDSMFNNLFLGLEPTPWVDYGIASVSNGWQIDRGSLMRIAPGDRFALYPMSATLADLNDPAKAITRATAVSVQPSSASLKIDDTAKLEAKGHYKAVQLSRAAAVSVSYEGDAEGIDLLRSAATSARNFREGPNLSPDPQLCVKAANGSFTITTGGTDRVLFGPVTRSSEGAAEVACALEHMALWILRRDLANPKTQIPAEWVNFVITRNSGRPDQADLSCPPNREIDLQYAPNESGQWKRPPYKIRIENKGPVKLYVALLGLSEDWNISTLLDSVTEVLGAGETVYARTIKGDTLYGSVSAGATESIDDFLLVVSTDLFDALDFRLGSLPEPGVVERGIGTDPEDTPLKETPIPQHDFFTRRVTLRTTRPAN